MPWVAFEPQTVEQRVALIERWQAEWSGGGDSTLGILCDGRVVGGTGLHRRVGPDGLEIGYWVHVDHVGRGYAQEASAALTDVALSLPGIERVVIRHDAANRRSEGVPDGSATASSRRSATAAAARRARPASPGCGNDAAPTPKEPARDHP